MVVNRKVVDVEVREEGAKVLRFEDGGTAEADLVVGADGIWSVVRRCMFVPKANGREYKYAPHYEGLVGVGSFVPAKLMEGVPQGQMKCVKHCRPSQWV